MRTLGILCVLAVLTVLCAPASALPPCGVNCTGTYESCVESFWSYENGLAASLDNLCASLEAGCWNNCVSSNYTYCKSTYTYWDDGDYNENKDFESFATASHEDNDFLLVSHTNNCW